MNRVVFNTVIALILLAFNILHHAQAATDKKILMVLWRGYTPTEESFKVHLQSRGISPVITEIAGKQDRNILASELRGNMDGILSGKYDLIYTYGTTATAMTANLVKGKVPIIFNIVFDPVGAGIVTSLEKPGRNITGITNGVPIASQLNIFHKLKPFENMVLLFTAREKNANIVYDKVKAWCTEKGINLNSFRSAPNTNSLDKALEKLKSGAVPCDMIYAGADAYLATRAGDVHKAVGAKYPLFGGTPTFVKAGWLGAYSPPLDSMGQAAAEKTQKVLNGMNPGEIPVTLPQPRLVISRKAADNFGIQIPGDANSLP